MKPYPKIQTVYSRNPETNYRTLIEGEWAREEFGYLADNEWLFTEKVDGTNIRVHWDGERVLFGGRTDQAQIPAFLVNRLQELFPVEKFKEAYPDHESMTLYGEGYGARIQKGGGDYIPDGVSFILFDVLVDDWWLRRDDVEAIAYILGINVVPIVGYGTLYQAIEVVRADVESRVGNCAAEGLVMRPAIDLLNRAGQRVIAKIKYKDFD